MAYIGCLGCSDGQMECERLRLFLKANNFEIVGEPGVADILILWVCGLTQARARLSRSLIWKLAKERKPEAEFVIWGCLPYQDPSAIPKISGTVVIGRRDTDALERLIGGSVRFGDITANSLFPLTPLNGLHLILRRFWVADSHLSYLFDIGHDQFCSRLHPGTAEPIYYIMTSRGCLEHCTFCSDRVSCGRIQSKPIEKIVTELELGIKGGFRSFGLLSTDIGAYGKDLGYTLCDLLTEFEKVDGSYRLYLGFINPTFLKGMWSDLLTHFRTGKIVETGISGQSGSNRVLKLMGRGYTAEDFEAYVKKLKSSFPSVMVTTQLMVGFPTETEDDFGATIGLVERIDFDHVEVFKFSRRPTTPASRLKGQVPSGVAERRYRQLVLKGLLSEVRAANKRSERSASSKQG